MAGFGNIMQNIFGAAPTRQAAQAPNIKTPGNFPTNPEILVDPANPTVPNGGNNENVEKPPMEQFAKLFETDPNAKPTGPIKTLGNIDKKTLMDAAKTNDFKGLVTPEMQAAILKGGPEAAAAFVEALNSVGQKSFGDSTYATTQLIEKALETQRQEFQKQLPGIVKGYARNDTLKGNSELFNNPAVAPMIDMISAKVAEKHPNATASEQAQMVNDYVNQFAQAANPEKKPAPGTDAKGNKTDWSDWAE